MFYKQQLFAHVAWCLVERDDGEGILGSRYSSLQEHLQNLQVYSEIKKNSIYFPRANIMFTIDRKYWIKNNSDWNNTEIIFNEYKKYLIDRYFTGCLYANKWISRLSDGEYFIFTLHNFLMKNRNEHHLCGHDIRTYKRSDDNYRYYELTDFGVVYYKLLVITDAYCIAFDDKRAELNFNNHTQSLDTNTLMFYK